MTADKRNAVVVIALIVSMTVGAGVLLLLEPANKPRWEGFPQLMAERATPVQAVQVAYAASDEDPAALDDGRHSLCVIDGEGEVTWMARGPRWRVVVAGSGTGELTGRQKAKLLAVLGNLNQASGQELVPVRLAPESTLRSNPARSPQAAGQTSDLRKLLARKKIIE